jgi:hypothetical protein
MERINADDASLVDEKLARLRAHRNNIHRYRKLLATELTAVEHAFVMKRLDEENEAVRELFRACQPVRPAYVLTLRSA